MTISSIFSRTWETRAVPFASAISWASPTSSSAWMTMKDTPPSRSHRPRECAKTAAWSYCPSRKIRSSGTKTSSKMTMLSGMDLCALTGWSRGSRPSGWYVVLVMCTPSALTGTAQAIA